LALLGFATSGRRDTQDAELFGVLAYTGLRLGEIVALRWSDVDLTDSSSSELFPQAARPSKANRVRHLGLATPAAQALARMAGRLELLRP
jgi:integrase